jgi:hypothetical protein
MKKMQQTAPEYTVDSGQSLVHVALANTTERATMYAEDYERLIDVGYSRHWSLTSTGASARYVLVNARSIKGTKRSLTVARLVADAGKGSRVRYVDGDRLNLRTENLALVKGPARSPADSLRPRKMTMSGAITEAAADV